MRITHQVADKENSRCTQDEGNVVVRQEEQHADGGHDQQNEGWKNNQSQENMIRFPCVDERPWCPQIGACERQY